MSEPVHKLGEVLRAAREAKGVDLARVERDTKIRERYLSALERGEYRDLPGSVYTRGFLRNYGAYLELDPEYLIDLFRLETSVATERPRAPTPPRPITTRRSRGFVVTPQLLFAALLTIGVGAFIAYIGYELVNFARQPELRITEPATNVGAYTETTMTVSGETAPNARVTVSNLTENPTVVADAQGRFEVTVRLLPGSNVIELQAYDPVTERDSEIERRTVIVVSQVAASPSPAAVAVTLEQPPADAVITGAVPIAGTAAPSSQLQASATLVTAAAPSFTVTDPGGAAVAIEPVASPPPAPLTIGTDAAGAFSASFSLAPGTWDVTITPDGEAITRRVTVQPGDGLDGALTVSGGESYLEVEEDGAPIAGASGTIAADGASIELSANTALRIRAGNASAVRLAINGINIGAMGGDGEVVEWRITRSGG
ncbi:MAG TPA: RodZ domain-containing protein [Candidatus Binatia bacterium]|nr:RodZ domain-containing protein [Candidatus Binatia bacterium]